MIKLKNYQDQGFEPPSVDNEVVEELSNVINDGGYFDFIKRISNGGFFFDTSLHIYGVCKSPAYDSITYVNNIIGHEYGELAKNLVFFAQEALGNQFAFSDKGVVMFNIETAEVDLLSEDFASFVDALFNDLDYLTGRGFIAEWKRKNNLTFDQRLCAKKPFVVGGDYGIENFYAQFFPTYLSSNANIAKQIHDLPDGTEIKIDIVD